MYYGLNLFQTNFYVKFFRCNGLLSQNLAFIFIWERTPASKQTPITMRGCCGRDRMVVGFISTYAISAHHQLTLRVWIPLRRGLLDTTLCDKVCQWLATGRWFSPGITVSFTNKTDRHHIIEILLKFALNTITPL